MMIPGKCRWAHVRSMCSLGALLLVLSGGNALAKGRATLTIPLGLDAYMPVPDNNPPTAEKISLGRRLFFDTLLSRDRSLSCSTCHDPRRSFTDGRRVSVGVFRREGPRNVPTLINRAYGKTFFWDGRTSSLEEQVLQPVQNPKEMDLSLDEAAARLGADAQYAEGFRDVFGREVCAEDLGRALASFVRTILSGDSPFDRYVAGERAELSEEARRGLEIFRGKGNCTACHLGPTFTDEQFHNTGVAWREGEFTDLGRFTVTGKDADRGAFKTPTLREVAHTPPYMHDGSLATLEEVINFYDGGGRPNTGLDKEIRPLRLTAVEKQALQAFLQSLSGSVQSQ